MKCFYHGDADGICAGFWVSYYTNDNNPEDFIKIDYGTDFPFDIIQKDEQVYIVDYSIMPDEMERLLSITENVVWIDHHKTAIERYKNFSREIKGIRYDGIAGCMLTWLYFNEYNPEDENNARLAPRFTQLIADYDVWKFEYGEQSKYFQIAFNMMDFSPVDEQMKELTISTVLNMIDTGRAIYDYKKSWSKKYCENLGFEREFHGHKAYIINLGMVNSDNFASVDDGTYDLLIGFVYDGSKWKYSLRSATVDVSEIAKLHGGGGHKGAAGFITDKLLF